MTEAEAIGELRSGMTVGIGGWGSRRKPMSLVRELLRSDITDLTVVSYGGPDVGLLCAAGKVRKVISGFVSLDTIPLEPHYRAARQAGSIAAEEWDEGMLMLGLMAATWRVPFLPTRAGLGSDVLSLMSDRFRTVRSPFEDGEDLVAVPALHLDAALLHLNRADAGGNAQFLGADLYMDDWFAQAAERTYVSAEKVVATADLLAEGTHHTLRVSRLMTHGVIEAPGGAHFTECPPDAERDESFQRHYATCAADAEAWTGFRARFLEQPDEATYRAEVDAWRDEQREAQQGSAS
jgi:glutaconate CoA-transferase subunit A